MRILGLDPGTATTGFGVVDEASGGKIKYVAAGVVSTPKTDPMPERLKTIHSEISQLIHEFKPDQISIELLYFATNVTTAISVGQARGVGMLAAAQAGIPIVEFTPLQVKQAITGYGKATKNQVQEMVKALLNLKSIPKPDDAADALAIAIAAAHSAGGVKSEE